MRFTLRRERGRPSPAVLVSVALHVVLGIVLARAVMNPGSLPGWLRRERAPKPAEERVTYVAVRAAPAPGPTVREGGDGRPAGRTPPAAPAPPLVAPPPVQRGLPEPTPGRAATGEGSGAVFGTPGPLRGAAPTYADPRVWVRPGAPVGDVAPPDETLDSLVTTGIAAYNDSVALADKQRKPGDWTISKNGKRYGLDRGKLVLGDLSIPIPFGLQAPPGQDSERERIAARITAEIQQQSRRAMTETEFRTAVRNIRERKERERARNKAPQGEVVATPD